LDIFLLNRLKSVKLHKKFFLSYSLVFLIVIAIIFLILWRQISNTYRSEIQHEARDINSQFQNSYELLEREVLNAVKELTEDYRMAEELKIQQEKRLAAERIAAWRDVARMVAHEKSGCFVLGTKSYLVLYSETLFRHPRIGDSLYINGFISVEYKLNLI